MCGCAGKTDLSTVVRPARGRLRERTTDGTVRLAGDLDAGLLPLTTRLRREVASGDRDVDRCDHHTRGADGDLETAAKTDDVGRRYALLATFADPVTGSDAETFADHVGNRLEALAREGSVTLAKGHAVQLPGADTPTTWHEQLRPVGRRLTGYRLASVDVVHALPGFGFGDQLAVACRHAVNDCYALGAADDIEIRPLVAAPRTAGLRPVREAVVRWRFDPGRDAVTKLEPAVIGHGGDRWLFGATVTAALTHRPPTRADQVGPGDGILLHRKFGALAAYALAVQRDEPVKGRRAAVAELLRDHRTVAEVIAAFCPDSDEPFDPTRHVKLATDVSGPGIGGVSDRLRRRGFGIRLDRLPFVLPDEVREARAAWLLPDATIGLNGPIVVVAKMAVIKTVEERLRRVEDADPVLIGHVSPDPDRPLTSRDDVDLSFYIEGAVHTGAR